MHPHIHAALLHAAPPAVEEDQPNTGIIPSGWHGELLSLYAGLGQGDHAGGLTAQFSLPHCPWFGT
jgi:hypothetical protein